MWNRELVVLGQTVHLSSINMEEDGSQPRFILLRQCWWGQGEDRRPGDYFVEATFPHDVSRVIEPHWIARQCAMSPTYQEYRWTLVELGWHDDDRKAGNPPHVFNVLVYAADGSYDDSEQQKLHREAIRAAMAVKS